MIYAAELNKEDSAINVGAFDSKPLVPIRHFETIAAMKAELNRIWPGGKNLVRIPRRKVEGWFGKAFSLTACGVVRKEWDDCRCEECR